MTLTESTRAALELRYQKAAEDYMASLPLEHFMESTTHATQRKISWDSLGLLADRRPDVHVFSELLVQYPRPRRKPGQVVPDNMVVIHDGPIDADLSYNTPFATPPGHSGCWNMCPKGTDARITLTTNVATSAI